MPTLINITRAYILRGEAYSALQEHFTAGGFKDYDDGQKCMDRIKAIPAADVVERPRWIPVTERLPENCADVLAYIERNAWGDEDMPYRKREIAIAYHVNGMWHVDGCAGVVCIAWQPLPEPPEAAP